MMLEMMEKTLLAGLGAAVLTQKKAEELVDDLKARLNLSEEEGKNLLEKLRQTAQENQQKLEELAQQEIAKACDRAGVASLDELNKLRERINQLEERMNQQAPS